MGPKRTKELPGQQHIEGIEVDPAPKTLSEAMLFFRLHCKATIEFRPDYDLLKVSLKVEDPGGDDNKYERPFELDPPGLENHKNKIIEIAQNFHAFKKKIANGESLG